MSVSDVKPEPPALSRRGKSSARMAMTELCPSCSWVSRSLDLPAEGPALEQFVERHRRHIEPWLSAVFQSEHLALLVGSGFSIGLARAVGATSVDMSTTSFLDALDAKITAAATRTAKRMGRQTPNIEDQFSACIALLDGLEILGDAQADALRGALRRELVAFANSVVDMELDILAKVNASGESLQIFRDLLSSFLLSFASRTATRDRLHLFTTNYDRVLEHGFDLVGIRPIDRFVGGLSPMFRSSRFDVDIHYGPQGARLEARPLEGVVRYTKLHGSVDWFYEDGCVRRHASGFGEKNPHLKEDSAEALMIYPNPCEGRGNRVPSIRGFVPRFLGFAMSTQFFARHLWLWFRR
jgi:hypothetical protein